MTSRYKKQHGLHHGHSKQYLKVYWPYLPVLLFVIIGMSASVITLVNKHTSSSASITANGIVADTNEQRQDSNLAPLVVNPNLAQAAQAKASDMVAQNYWSHNTPTGQTPWQFIAQKGYNFSLAGENLAYGFSNSDAVLNAWMNSQDHRANILNSSYKNIGIGIAHSSNYQNDGSETVVVAMYASPSGSTLSSSTGLNSGQPFTSISSIQPNPQTVGRVETLTSSNSTIAVFVSGIIGGVAFTILVIRHGLFIKRWARQSEGLIFEHPFLDILLVMVVVSSAVLNQTAGFIR
jgi:uncharacterized protein YkwD